MAENKRFDAALRSALVRWNETERQREEEREIPAMPSSFWEAVPPVHPAGKTERKNNKEEYSMKQTKKWRKSTAAALAAAALVAGSVCVYAAVPAVRAYINMLFLKEESVMRLTTVPEGYIGITTPEELEAVREKLDGNYILMNDIRIPDEWYEDGGIYEDGFAPIGGDPLWRETKDGVKYIDDTKAFTGIFNGNGHVISNVHIQADGDNDYVGLFGLSEMVFEPVSTRDENGEAGDYGYDLETYGGIIKNLGVVDSSIAVDEQDLGMSGKIGMIVGEGAYVIGCYTDNVTITYSHSGQVNVPETDNTATGSNVYTYTSEQYSTDGLKIGGVVGEAILVDSCWSGADMVINAPAPQKNNMYLGGVCGYTPTCVTSYFDGTIAAPVEDWGVAYTIQVDPPVMITKDVIYEIGKRLIEAQNPDLTIDWDILQEEKWVGDEKKVWLRPYMLENYPDADIFPYEKFLAFYATAKYDLIQDFMTFPVEEMTEGQYPFLLDPALTARERRELSRLIDTVFTGEEFVKFCQENGVKYGAYDNYDLRREPDCDFEGFDFDYIWYREEGQNPVLRLFEYTWIEQGLVQYHDVPSGFKR